MGGGEKTENDQYIQRTRQRRYPRRSVCRVRSLDCIEVFSNGELEKYCLPASLEKIGIKKVCGENGRGLLQSLNA